jgi:hypothetical protein
MQLLRPTASLYIPPCVSPPEPSDKFKFDRMEKDAEVNILFNYEALVDRMNQAPAVLSDMTNVEKEKMAAICRTFCLSSQSSDSKDIKMQKEVIVPGLIRAATWMVIFNVDDNKDSFDLINQCYIRALSFYQEHKMQETADQISYLICRNQRHRQALQKVIESTTPNGRDYELYHHIRDGNICAARATIHYKAGRYGQALANCRSAIHSFQSTDLHQTPCIAAIDFMILLCLDKMSATPDEIRSGYDRVQYLVSRTPLLRSIFYYHGKEVMTRLDKRFAKTDEKISDPIDKKVDPHQKSVALIAKKADEKEKRADANEKKADANEKRTDPAAKKTDLIEKKLDPVQIVVETEKVVPMHQPQVETKIPMPAVVPHASNSAPKPMVEPLVSSQEVHFFCACDHCPKPTSDHITGDRYYCAYCDKNICPRCESSNAHPVTHTLMKIKRSVMNGSGEYMYPLPGRDVVLSLLPPIQ